MQNITGPGRAKHSSYVGNPPWVNPCIENTIALCKCDKCREEKPVEGGNWLRPDIKRAHEQEQFKRDFEATKKGRTTDVQEVEEALPVKKKRKVEGTSPKTIPVTTQSKGGIKTPLPSQKGKSSSPEKAKYPSPEKMNNSPLKRIIGSSPAKMKNSSAEKGKSRSSEELRNSSPEKRGLISPETSPNRTRRENTLEELIQSELDSDKHRMSQDFGFDMGSVPPVSTISANYSAEAPFELHPLVGSVLTQEDDVISRYKPTLPQQATVQPIQVVNTNGNTPLGPSGVITISDDDTTSENQELANSQLIREMINHIDANFQPEDLQVLNNVLNSNTNSQTASQPAPSTNSLNGSNNVQFLNDLLSPYIVRAARLRYQTFTQMKQAAANEIHDFLYRSLDTASQETNILPALKRNLQEKGFLSNRPNTLKYASGFVINVLGDKSELAFICNLEQMREADLGREIVNEWNKDMDEFDNLEGPSTLTLGDLQILAFGMVIFRDDDHLGFEDLLIF